MIKNIMILVLPFVFFSSAVKAQDYLGLSTGNYGGIHAVMLQPANVADNRYQYEINLVSGSLNFSNNYVGISRDYFFGLREL